MNKNIHILALSAFILAILAIGGGIWQHTSQPKIGLIDNGQLISQFKGMIEAQQRIASGSSQRK